MSTANDLYLNAIRPLPADEQLRLASLILQGLKKTPGGPIDYREYWSDDDIVDLAAFAARHAVESTEME